MAEGGLFLGPLSDNFSDVEFIQQRFIGHLNGYFWLFAPKFWEVTGTNA